MLRIGADGMTATITALYAALDEPDADVTHILGLLADAYMDAGDACAPTATPSSRKPRPSS